MSSSSKLPEAAPVLPLLRFPMDPHHFYLEKYGVSKSGNEPEAEDIPTEFGTERRVEAVRITSLLNASPSFSLLRLGDMELTLLLAHQEGISFSQKTPRDNLVSGTGASGDPGVGTRESARLWRAFENADYVDFHEVLRVNRQLLEHLNLKRVPRLTQNPSKWTSYILPAWVQNEFRSYCDAPGRRCGIAAAEASLLEWLAARHEFQAEARAVWPARSPIVFHQLRDHGRNIAGNLEAIQCDLTKFVREHRLDTLFLSAGGAAKILCYELASELGIRAVDFGAMTRSLCDLGSDGNRGSRSTHSVQLHRLPCRLVVEGIKQTRPGLSDREFLAKIHAQLIHQLLQDRPGYSRGNSMLDFSRESKQRFRQARRECLPLLKKLRASGEAGIRKEVADFLHFCGRHGLTIEGRCFMLWFRVKGLVKSLLRRFHKFE